MITGYRTRCFQQVVHKAGKFIGKKFQTQYLSQTMRNDESNIEKKGPAEEIIIPPEKRDEILNKLRRVL